MKVICLVPSITETLIDCGVTLIGRSRFCIHPESKVSSIPKVGGTKDINWEKISHLHCDLVILDKEENTLAMAENCPFNYIALHITNISNVSTELLRLAKRLNNNRLRDIAQRWSLVAQHPAQPISLEKIPAMIEWWKKPVQQTQILYLIWRDPWMAIGNNTFIQSVMDHCGLQHARIENSQKYPSIDLNSFNPKETILLFSSEPYPFKKYQQEMCSLGFCCGLVDGEKYSWYGIRSLKFLESLS